MSSRPSSPPLLREAPQPATALELQKRIESETRDLGVSRDRLDALKQSRVLREKSDPTLTKSDLQEFDRAEAKLIEDVQGSEKMIGVLQEQLSALREREWEEKARKERIEIEAEQGQGADASYERLAILEKQFHDELRPLREKHLRAAHFNAVTAGHLPPVELAEQRVRFSLAGPGKSARYLKPLWEELKSLPPVYAGDGYLDLGAPKSVSYLEAPPKRPEPPKAPPPPAHNTPISMALPRFASEPVREERPYKPITYTTGRDEK